MTMSTKTYTEQMLDHHLCLSVERGMVRKREQTPQQACEHIMRLVNRVAGRKLMQVIEFMVEEHQREIDVLNAQITAIVQTAGGEVEGLPTSTVNILQRIRQLRAIETQQQ